MIVGKNYFAPGDAIIKVGLEKWLNYKDNLITVKEKIFIHNIIFSNYLKIFCSKKLQKEKYFLGISNTILIQIITKKIVNELVIKRLKKKKVKKVINKEKEITLEEFFNQDSKYQIKYKFYNKHYFKNMIKFLIIKIKHLYYKLIRKKKVIFSINKLSKDANFFFKCCEYHPIIFERNLFTTENFSLNLDQQNKQWIKNQTRKFCSILKKKLSLENNLSDSIYLDVKKKLIESMSYILINSKKLKSSKKTFFSYALGSPVNRAFLAACRLSNLKTIAIVHGNSFLSLFYNSKRILTDCFSIADEVKLNFAIEKKIVEKKIIKYKNYIILPKFDVINYSKISNKLLNSSEKKNKIEKIMLVGMPHNQINNDWYSDKIVLNSYSHLRLEIQIIKMLIQKNYKVLYQKHPESQLDYKKIFKNLQFTISNKKFEDSYHLSDCIVFPHNGTSTFGYALLTNKPLILFNFNKENEHNDYLKIINNRCSIIRANQDKYGKILFSKEKLFQGIKKSPYLKNYNLAKKLY